MCSFQEVVTFTNVFKAVPSFSSIQFSVSGFIFRCLSHLNLSLVQDFIPLINMPVFILILYGFYYSRSGVELEIRDADASGSSSVVQECFSLLVFFVVVVLILYEVQY